MTNKLTEIRRFNHDESQPWIVDILANSNATIGYVLADGTPGSVRPGSGGFFTLKYEAQEAEALYLKKIKKETETSAGENVRVGHEEDSQIRTFVTGATRDTAKDKLDYVKALCPLVLRRYVQYLDKHRLQPDGNIRDFDNWKKGIPRETYHSSKGRHFFADWLLEEGYEVSDNHGPVDEEDALCGELFNTMGKLRCILKAKLPIDRTKPVSGGY